MHKLKHTFIFLFLLGILFPVLHYIPFSNEESNLIKSELNEKTKEGCTSDDDKCDDDNTDDNKPANCSSQTFDITSEARSVRSYFILHQLYKHTKGKICTPPPEV
jgi:hypothetical protein